LVAELQAAETRLPGYEMVGEVARVLYKDVGLPVFI
jgi:hypothetical protein